MSDRVFFAGAGALAAAMVFLALVWPQGQRHASPPSPPPAGAVAK